MSASSAIIQKLLSNTDLTGIIGDAIRPVKLAQSDSFSGGIVVHHVGTDPSPTKSGVSQADLEQYVVSIISSLSFAQCELLAGYVRDSLDMWGPETIAGVNVSGCNMTNQQVQPYNDEVDTYHITQQYQIRVDR